ncbi:hypothetical protein [Rhodococcoides kroppenstedtii]|uniref:hypothetical protein n=1 Tax=Rhodococcoides kroppenstedtii TaxID=293050 RepID=UPI003640C77E
MRETPKPVLRACDVVDLTCGEPSWLVWLRDDKGACIVRSAPTYTAAIEVGRAYRAAWSGAVLGIESPAGVDVPSEQWEPLLDTDRSLPYVYTVELRSGAVAGREHVSVLWTTTDLDSAIRHRSLLPHHLRRRTLIVSNAPDGAVAPRFPICGATLGDDLSS